MQRQGSKRSAFKISLILGTLLSGAVVVQEANAGCLDMTPFMKKTRFEDTRAQGGFLKTAYEEDYAPGFFHAPIVGLWAFKYVAEGNAAFKDGTQIDGGNTLWFADGNEVTYSAIRNPTTGATCLGVWKQTGRYTYELNHVGISWDPAVTLPMGGSSGPAFIRQHIKLAPDGNSYTGTFEISQLDKDGKTIAGPPFPIKGRIEATRVGLDTTTQTLPTSGDEKP